jgi:hypothetical protein
MEKEEFEALTTEEEFRKQVLQFIVFTRDQFVDINTRLNTQDAAIAQNTTLTSTVANETKAVREFMVDGANAAKLFCRVAAAWRFVWRWIAVPICLPLALIYAAGYYHEHGTFPTWVIAIAKALGW